MITASRVLQKYNICLEESLRQLNHLSLAAKYVRFKADSQSKEGYVKLTLTEPLYFIGWPYRSASRTKLDIVATVDETVCLDSGRCANSRCCVNYFRIDGDHRIACDAIHYDFDASIQLQHPICHAQNANRTIDNLPSEFPDYVDKSALRNRHQLVRIPTAFVNLAGLIQALTADHLSPQNYIDFWAACEPYVANIPDHVDGAESRAICESKTLRNRNWYKR